MKPRLVLVKPPETTRFNFGAFSLAVLSADLKSHANVTILDATGMEPNRAIEAILAQRPQWVGVTVMGLASQPAVCALLQALHVAAPSLTLVAGGQGATLDPLPLLQASATFVVLGEGERTMAELIDMGPRPGTAGTAYLQGNQLVQGPPRPLVHPLDQLRLPDRKRMPLPTDGIHLMETSRGCPNACTFCTTTRFHGKSWRPFSPGRVAQDVGRLVTQFDAWIIHLADDNFAAHPGRVLEICEALTRAPKPALFSAAARIEDLVADPRIIPALARAGVLRIHIGLESLDPRMTPITAKAMDLNACKEGLAQMRAHGIFTLASLIVGLPGTHQEHDAVTFQNLLHVGPDAARFLPFLPFPGLPIAGSTPTWQPSHEHELRAMALTQAYAQHPSVQARLKQALDKGGIRGRLAHGSLATRNL